MASKKKVCDGCLMTRKEILANPCSSQNCPPGYVEMTVAQIKKEQKNRDSYKPEAIMAAITKRYQEAYKNINDYSAWVRSAWLNKEELTDKDLTVMALGIGGEAGEVQEVIKKFVRDGNLDKKNLMKELGDVIYYWCMLCHYFELDPSEVVATNVQKIELRKQFGTLQGSGNDR